MKSFTKIGRSGILILITLGFIGLVSYLIISQIRHEEMNRRFGSTIDLAQDSIYKDGKKLTEWLPSQYDGQSRLFFLCKTWGFLKYYAENKYNTKVDADKALFLFLDKLTANPEIGQTEYNHLLKEMISSMQVDSLYGSNPFPDINDYALISNGWMTDSVCLDEENGETLQNIFLHHRGNGNRWVNNSNIGLVQRQHLPD